MIEIDSLCFDSRGLIPAIVSDYLSGQVLMLGYMNRESLEISMREGLCCFWSRSRSKLWTKGETSGNFLHIVSITADCDRDTLLVKARPDGPVCHLGTQSCFEYPLYAAEDEQSFSADELLELLKGRREQPKEGSYTSYLFEKGRDKILKKVGEEATEVIIAAKADDKRETVYEIADLMYHVMVLMTDMDIDTATIRRELASRHIVEHKVKQEKMT